MYILPVCLGVGDFDVTHIAVFTLCLALSRLALMFLQKLLADKTPHTMFTLDLSNFRVSLVVDRKISRSHANYILSCVLVQKLKYAVYRLMQKNIFPYEGKQMIKP